MLIKQRCVDHNWILKTTLEQILWYTAKITTRVHFTYLLLQLNALRFSHEPSILFLRNRFCPKYWTHFRVQQRIIRISNHKHRKKTKTEKRIWAISSPSRTQHKIQMMHRIKRTIRQMQQLHKRFQKKTTQMKSKRLHLTSQTVKKTMRIIIIQMKTMSSASVNRLNLRNRNVGNLYLRSKDLLQCRHSEIRIKSSI